MEFPPVALMALAVVMFRSSFDCGPGTQAGKHKNRVDYTNGALNPPNPMAKNLRTTLPGAPPAKNGTCCAAVEGNKPRLRAYAY
jgi:hypothetical protein